MVFLLLEKREDSHRRKGELCVFAQHTRESKIAIKTMMPPRNRSMESTRGRAADWGTARPAMGPDDGKCCEYSSETLMNASFEKPWVKESRSRRFVAAAATGRLTDLPAFLTGLPEPALACRNGITTLPWYLPAPG